MLDITAYGDQQALQPATPPADGEGEVMLVAPGTSSLPLALAS
jgi:hypothetical protein